jgi:phosphate transport system substrate-binding protein
VSVYGAPANEANVQSGKYPFWSYEHIYTNGQPSEPVAAFIAFVSNDKDLMEKTGYILVHDMKVSETDR